MTPERAAALVSKVAQAVNDGYHNRDDYPPYKLVPWEDRLVFLKYVEAVMKDVLEKEDRE